MEPFEALLSAHRVPSPVDNEENAKSSATDDALLRADAEANPLDGLDSIARLRALELQEGRASASPSPIAWFNQPLDELGIKLVNSVLNAARDVWNIKARTPESIARELVQIMSGGERPLYLIMFGIIMLLLFRARTH